MNADHIFEKFHRAIKAGDVIAIRNLVTSGLDVNTRNRFGWTPLMVAGVEGHTTIISYLLSIGAQVSQVNDFGASPLAYAALSGECRAIQALLDAGAPVNVRPHGVSLLEFAERGGGRSRTRRHFEILREAGAV